MLRWVPVATILLFVGSSTAEATPRSVVGSWAGVVQESVLPDPNPILVEIDRLRLGKRAGFMRYTFEPGLCEGPLILRRRTALGFVFRYRETNRTENCTGDERVYMRLRRGRRVFARVWQPFDTEGDIRRGLLRPTACGASVRAQPVSDVRAASRSGSASC